MPGLPHRANTRLVRARAEARIARIGRSGRPVMAGPWLGEVGIELLFWIPFLQWFCERYRIAPERVTAVSRGGAEAWYARVAGRYVDAFDHFDAERVRGWVEQRVETTGSQKQMAVGPGEPELLAAIGGNSDHELLHPSLMFGAIVDFLDWRRATAPLARVLDRARYLPIATPPRGESLAGLPERYVAVKAYFNRVLPETDENRRFLAGVVERLAAHTDVVLLATGLELDDHADLLHAGGERVHTIEHVLEARDNLDVQTRAIGHAEALVGTFGGLSYLAALQGVDSFSFYERDIYIPTHRDLMVRASRAVAERGVDAGFVLAPVGAARTLESLLA